MRSGQRSLSAAARGPRCIPPVRARPPGRRRTSTPPPCHHRAGGSGARARSDQRRTAPNSFGRLRRCSWRRSPHLFVRQGPLRRAEAQPVGQAPGLFVDAGARYTSNRPPTRELTPGRTQRSATASAGCWSSTTKARSMSEDGKRLTAPPIVTRRGTCFSSNSTPRSTSSQPTRCCAVPLPATLRSRTVPPCAGSIHRPRRSRGDLVHVGPGLDGTIRWAERVGAGPAARRPVAGRDQPDTGRGERAPPDALRLDGSGWSRRATASHRCRGLHPTRSAHLVAPSTSHGANGDWQPRDRRGRRDRSGRGGAFGLTPPRATPPRRGASAGSRSTSASSLTRPGCRDA